jgi:hypothetical protein
MQGFIQSCPQILRGDLLHEAVAIYPVYTLTQTGLKWVLSRKIILAALQILERTSL